MSVQKSSNQMEILKFLSNGGLLKMFAIMLLFIFALGAGALVAYELLNNQPMNPFLTGFIGTVIGTCIKIVGADSATQSVDHGVDLAANNGATPASGSH